MPSPGVLVLAVLFALCVGAGLLFFTPGLRPEVEDAAVLVVERDDAQPVLDDEDLAAWLDGDLDLSERAATVAGCHALLGDAGDWSMDGDLVVSERSDLVRVGEMLANGDTDEDTAARIEAYLFQHPSVPPLDDSEVHVVAQTVLLSFDAVADYLRLREREPDAKSPERFVVYASNVTTTLQQLVWVDTARFPGADFSRVPGGMDGRMTLAGRPDVNSISKRTCAALTDT